MTAAYLVGSWVLCSPAAAVLLGRSIRLADEQELGRPPRHRRPLSEVAADLRRWGALCGLLAAGLLCLFGGDWLHQLAAGVVR